MYKSLNGPAIGIKGLTLPELVALARATGFVGVDFDMREALALPDANAVFGETRAAQWGLPVTGVQSEWAIDLKELAACARLGASLDATRCTTWVPSWSDSRGLADNLAFHIDRLTPAAKILADHGCHLGLEFLGPITLIQAHKYAFIRQMGPMMEMARQIGPNTGLLMDAWHLFTSGGTLADLAGLQARDIVNVHISDAPKGVPFDQVQDNVRHLPPETGVLDLAGFLRTLAGIGYDGPVTTEPFNARLNTIAARDPTAAAREVSGAMDLLWRNGGLQA